jgi:phage gp46-like protein
MDIALAYNNVTGEADWVIANGDLAPGADLESAILVSLFTDARATLDFVPWNDTDRRGWWGDSFEQRALGSNLWQLDRAYFSANNNLLLKARDYCKAALQWLIDDGVAASISVTPTRSGTNGLLLNIVVTKPVTNEAVPFTFSYFWNQEGL